MGIWPVAYAGGSCPGNCPICQNCSIRRSRSCMFVSEHGYKTVKSTSSNKHWSIKSLQSFLAAVRRLCLTRQPSNYRYETAVETSYHDSAAKGWLHRALQRVPDCSSLHGETTGIHDKTRCHTTGSNLCTASRHTIVMRVTYSWSHFTTTALGCATGPT